MTTCANNQKKSCVTININCGEKSNMMNDTIIEEDALLYMIEKLGPNEILVIRPDSQVVIDGFTNDDAPGPLSATWPCIGKGVPFVRCVQDLVDNHGGCAIVRKHTEGRYCGKPC